MQYPTAIFSTIVQKLRNSLFEPAVSYAVLKVSCQPDACIVCLGIKVRSSLMSKICKLMAMCLSIVLLSGCAVTGKYEVNMQQAAQLGFNKSEMLELGQLVNVAYELFNGGKQPQNSNPDFPSDFVPGFTPVVNLQGQDSSSRKKEFYGHLSWRNREPGTLVVSIRGTADTQEWLDDAKFEKVDFSDNKDFGCVELGFKEIFSSFTVSKPKSDVFMPLNQYLQTAGGVKKIIVVGHSLGSSLATLVAFNAVISGFTESVQLLTFASPFTGDAKFVKAFQARNKDSVRIVNRPDLVPRVPPKLFGYRHVWHQLEIDSYPNAGIKHSVVCYHSLLTYLHMLDSAIPLAPNCAAKF